MSATPTTSPSTEHRPQVYKVATVAEILCCDTSTVYRLIDSGALSAVRLGRVIRVTQSAIDDFLGLSK